MNIFPEIKLFYCLTIVVVLVGCQKSDEALKLGFIDDNEMKEIHAKGWHTKERYEEDIAKAAGFSSYAEMKRVEEEKSRQSDIEKARTKNFLIGKCIVSAGNNSESLIDYACEASTAREYSGPLSAVPYMIYRESTIQVNVIIGANVRNNPQIAPNVQPQDVVLEFPIDYKFISPNKIMAEIIGKGGCITKTEFEINGSEIYSTSLPSAGTCDSSQMVANKHTIERGRQKVFYKELKY